MYPDKTKPQILNTGGSGRAQHSYQEADGRDHEGLSAELCPGTPITWHQFASLTV